MSDKVVVIGWAVVLLLGVIWAVVAYEIMKMTARKREVGDRALANREASEARRRLRARHDKMWEEATVWGGEIYEHYKGGYYAVLVLGRLHDTHEPMVVYSHDGDVRIRSLEEWAAVDGSGKPRFAIARPEDGEAKEQGMGC